MTAEDVAAIVPAHDEERRIATTVAALAETRRFREIIVVDDGSRDATSQRAREAGARVLRLPRNSGKGAAVRAGLAATPAPIVLLCDADLEASAAGMASLVAPVLSGEVDMAIAAPPRKGGPSGFGLVERLARWGIARSAGRSMDRPLSGQRAFRRRAFEGRIAGGFGVEVALTADALAAGARVVEVPIEVKHAQTGRTLAGFLHRGRQAVDVAWALAPRIVRGRSADGGSAR